MTTDVQDFLTLYRTLSKDFSTGQAVGVALGVLTYVRAVQLLVVVAVAALV